MTKRLRIEDFAETPEGKNEVAKQLCSKLTEGINSALLGALNIYGVESLRELSFSGSLANYNTGSYNVDITFSDVLRIETEEN